MSICPQTQEAILAFRSMALAPSDESPIVEMTDETARNLDVIWASIAAAAPRWRGGQDVRMPGMPTDRKAFWGAIAGSLGRPLPLADEFIHASSGIGKLAIDLGCGDSPAIRALLQRGWRVIGVDNSPAVLNLVKNKYPEALETGQLQLIEADIATFTPDQPADLVIAADILPYVNPAQFQNTWMKIHDHCVKENGVFIGSVFRTIQLTSMINMMKEMGAWFLPDRRMVRPLLKEAGYEILACRYRIDELGEADPIAIQFVATKKTAIGPHTT